MAKKKSGVPSTKRPESLAPISLDVFEVRAKPITARYVIPPMLPAHEAVRETYGQGNWVAFTVPVSRQLEMVKEFRRVFRLNGIKLRVVADYDRTEVRLLAADPITRKSRRAVNPSQQETA